jgi:hypothetical protein
MQKKILVKAGAIQFIHDDAITQALRGMGRVKIRRASHVEPTEDGEKWTADMSPVAGFPLILGPFETRKEALDAEIKWLSERLEKL